MLMVVVCVCKCACVCVRAVVYWPAELLSVWVYVSQ